MQGRGESALKPENNDHEPIKKTFTLSGYFKGDTIAQSQIVLVSEEYAKKAAPAPTVSAMETAVDASDYAGRIMADFNFKSSFYLEEQAAELARRCGFPEDIDTGINWAYVRRRDGHGDDSADRGAPFCDSYVGISDHL